MAKAYAVFTEDIKDPAGMEAYGAKAGPTIMQSGANVLAVADNVETLEGQWHGTRTVVLEFESVEAAKAWYNSPGYQEAIPLRQAAADSNGVIIPGIEMPTA